MVVLAVPEILSPQEITFITPHFYSYTHRDFDITVIGPATRSGYNGLIQKLI